MLLGSSKFLIQLIKRKQGLDKSYANHYWMTYNYTMQHLLFKICLQIQLHLTIFPSKEHDKIIIHGNNKSPFVEDKRRPIIDNLQNEKTKLTKAFG